MELIDEKYDIAIIGGGCVGSGIAMDATLRGYKVILLEKNDFASGASSKSSKLVHGGIRYLEKAVKEFDITQYNLVRDALKERAIFLKNTPFFSKKMKINIPIYSYPNLVYTYLGLLFYKLIAKSKSLGKNSFANKVLSILFSPNIKQKNLKGFLSFYDGSFLDTKVVISLLQTAVLNGAVIKNYCEVDEFLYENEKISGLKYFDKIQNKTSQIKAKIVINATGANVDNMRFLDDKNSNEILALSSGIHIVVSKDFLKVDEGILIPNTSDKRVIFILPYLNSCLIGTTDNKTIYDENPKVKEQEIEYLLKEVNKYFEIHLTKDDILSSWSGIRPLVRNEKKSTTQEIVREHTIIKSKNNLVSIAGGKWTTYRKMAEDMVNFLIKNRDLEKQKKCETKKYKLFGNDGDIKELEKLMSFYPISKKTKKSLKTLYGTACTKVLNLANENKNFDLINEELPYLKVEIEYCIKEEFVQKPIDFLSRRIGLCFINKNQSLACVDVLCIEMGKILFWDEEKIIKENIECLDYINNYF